MVNDVRVELHHSGVWNDITSDVRYDPPITIKWGRADEAARAAPASMSLALNDPTGKYSPRNPLSPLFGKIGRNTPIRVRLGAKNVSLALPGVEKSYVSTPDLASLDITGDIDIRLELTPREWHSRFNQVLAAKYRQADDNRSWILVLKSDGTLLFIWSPDGTFANALAKVSTAAIPDDGARRAVRVTLDVNNGASGNDVKFYTASSISGAWTQLGATVTTAGVTSIFSGTGDVEIGTGNNGGAPPVVSGELHAPVEARVWAFQLRNGIDGTVVANPDFTVPEAGALSFNDEAGKSWLLRGAAALTDTSVRFAGEVSSWPPRWDLSGADVRIPIEASGMSRRLGQGDKPLRSSLFRDLSTKDDVVAYWPLEDGGDADTFASGIPGDSSTLAPSGDVSLSNFSGYAASESIPTVEAGVIQGNIPSFTPSARQQISFLCAVPAGGVAGDRLLARFHTGGTIVIWDIVVEPNGNLRIRGFDSDGGQVFNTASFNFGMNGSLTMVAFRLEQSGQDTNWAMLRFIAGNPNANFIDGTQATIYSRIDSVRLGSTLGMAGTAYGHVFVLDDDIESVWDSISNSLIAWAGEHAGDRFVRLAVEEGIPVRLIGRSADTEQLGPQRIDTLTNLMDEVAEVDLGILADDRDATRLLYRIRADLYNQDVTLALDYPAGQVAPTLEPVDDDEATRNDVTVKRPGGSSHNATLTSGPLSTQAPPAGVGRYDVEQEINVHSDGQLPSQAGWRLHLGTADEARWPTISVDLTATPSLVTDAMAVYAGDRIQITNPPAWLPPETIDQLAQGGTEQLTPHRHTTAFNTSPASPWTVGVVGDDLARADTEDSTTTASFVSGTGTSMTVATNRGPIWTVAVGQFPFDIRVGGVVLTVTAISGAASPQTFTIAKAPVNGVNRTIPAGTALSLAHPAIVAL